MNFTLVSRKNVYITLTARLADGQITTIAGASVAITPMRQSPNAATIWWDTVYASGVAEVLLVGPQADPTGGVVIPIYGGDLWVRVIDEEEIDAVLVTRINMR